MRISDYIDADLLDRFEFYNYNHAIEIITQAFPKEWSDVVECLRKLDITTDDLREAGGNETKIPKKFDDVQTTGSIGAVYADMPDVVARAKVFIQMIDLADTEEEQYANYLTAFFDAKSLPELVNPLCQKYWELTFSAMEEKYPDAYPAHIFKNIGRLREIKEQICLRDSKSQEE